MGACYSVKLTSRMGNSMVRTPYSVELLEVKESQEYSKNIRPQSNFNCLGGIGGAIGSAIGMSSGKTIGAWGGTIGNVSQLKLKMHSIEQRLRD